MGLWWIYFRRNSIEFTDIIQIHPLRWREKAPDGYHLQHWKKLTEEDEQEFFEIQEERMQESPLPLLREYQEVSVNQAARLADALDKLTMRMNPITAAWRHCGSIEHYDEEMDVMCNEQIEAEKVLKEYRASIE